MDFFEVGWVEGLSFPMLYAIPRLAFFLQGSFC